MKKIIIAAALAIAATAAPGPDHARPRQAPAKWTTLNLSSDVIAKPAYLVWDKINALVRHREISRHQGLQDRQRPRRTGLGAHHRHRHDQVVEIVVARTPYSYTYAQPFTPIFYHGTLGVEAVDATHSKITYTLIWNESAVGDAAAQAAARDSRQKRFQAAVDKMSAAAKAD